MLFITKTNKTSNLIIDNDNNENNESISIGSTVMNIKRKNLCWVKQNRKKSNLSPNQNEMK